MKRKNTLAMVACSIAAIGLIAATLVARAQTPTTTQTLTTQTPTTQTPATTQAPATTTTPATPAADPAARVAAIKASLAQSQQNLKSYQWVETEVVNYKGEDKSSTENSCYYDVSGKLVKVPAAVSEDENKKRGVRGKIVANKSEELATYMQGAATLVKSYIPPDPAKIEAAKNAGKVSTTPSGDGKQMRVDIKDYEKPGDTLTIELDNTTNQIVGLGVNSYLTDAKDTVTLNVTMASLPDGTQYPASVVLDAVAKEMKVTTTNSGYTKKAN